MEEISTFKKVMLTHEGRDVGNKIASVLRDSSLSVYEKEDSVFYFLKKLTLDSVSHPKSAEATLTGLAQSGLTTMEINTIRNIVFKNHDEYAAAGVYGIPKALHLLENQYRKIVKYEDEVQQERSQQRFQSIAADKGGTSTVNPKEIGDIIHQYLENKKPEDIHKKDAAILVDLVARLYDQTNNEFNKLKLNELSKSSINKNDLAILNSLPKEFDNILFNYNISKTDMNYLAKGVEQLQQRGKVSDDYSAIKAQVKNDTAVKERAKRSDVESNRAPQLPEEEVKEKKIERKESVIFDADMDKKSQATVKQEKVSHVEQGRESEKAPDISVLEEGNNYRPGRR